MKKLLFCLMLFPFAINAQVIELAGVYTYKMARVYQARDVELVQSINKERYEQLVAENFHCFLRGDFFMCQKFVKAELPASVRKEIHDAWYFRFFDFIPSGLFPAITNDSESLLEWDVFDTVKLDAFQASEYHYYIMKGKKTEDDVHKIIINFASGQKWLVVENEKSITTSIERIVRASTLRSRIFNLDLVFTKSE